MPDTPRILGFAPFVCKYYFLRFTAIQRQIVCPCPRFDVLNLGNPRVDVGWHNQVGVVGKFAKLVASSHALKSLAVTTYAAGPMAEPWMMLAGVL